MTKYILHGGCTGIKCESNNRFFAEILKDLKESARILMIYFAKPEEEWEDKLRKDKISFSSNSGGKKFELILANPDIKKLIEQIKNADAVYLHGGNQDILKEKMAPIANLKELFEGKTIAGSSAGAILLAEYSHSRSSIQPHKGLGIMPIKLVVHYSEELDNKLEDLKKYGDENMETYAIAETEFVVIET